MDVPHYVIPAEAGIQINFFPLFPMLYALCPMPYALCFMLSLQRTKLPVSPISSAL